MKKFRKILNLEETIALTSGVLVLSVAVALVVIAWTGPSAEAPLNNAPAPINVSNIAQTKTGDLTVGNLSLDGVGFEGSINNADLIIGANDLRLRADSTEQTKIDLGVGAQEIKFYTGGATEPIVTIGADKNLYVPGLTNCFLEVDAAGKVKCYAGGGIPGGDVLKTTQVLVANALIAEGDKGIVCDNYTVQLSDLEKVIRVYYYTLTASGSGNVKFYINGALEWSKGGTFPGVVSGSYYYHATGGDILKICADAGVGGIGDGKIYTLGARRELITHAFADEPKILYWYDQSTTGKIGEAGSHFIGPVPPVSVIISAKDAVDVSWILD